MRQKYRIRAVRSELGDRFYPEERGLIWGWNVIDLAVMSYSAGYESGEYYDRVVYNHGCTKGMSEAHAKLVIDYRIAQDSEKEEIIDYP